MHECEGDLGEVASKREIGSGDLPVCDEGLGLSPM